MLHNILYGKTISHTPVYQNFEYQLWESEAKTSTNSLKLPLHSTESVLIPRRANTVDTPTIVNEIRTYFACDSSKENLPTFPASFTGACNVAFHRNSPRCAKPLFNAGLEADPYYSQTYLPFRHVHSSYANAYQSPPHYEEPADELLTGRIKFFDSSQNYGFFVLDRDGSDLFVHYDNFLRAGMTKEEIQLARAMNVRFEFRKVSYYGKYKLSCKAVDIRVAPADCLRA